MEDILFDSDDHRREDDLQQRLLLDHEAGAQLDTLAPQEDVAGGSSELENTERSPPVKRVRQPGPQPASEPRPQRVRRPVKFMGDDANGADTDAGTPASRRTGRAGRAQAGPGDSHNGDRPPPRRTGAVSLKDLIDAGLLQPGPAALRSDYKGTSDYGDLLPDGRIQQGAHVFDSPSAFSIWSKRKISPGRKSDDGWKSLKHREKTLEQHKHVLQQRQRAEAAAAEQCGTDAGGQRPLRKSTVAAVESPPPSAARPSPSPARKPSIVIKSSGVRSAAAAGRAPPPPAHASLPPLPPLHAGVCQHLGAFSASDATRFAQLPHPATVPPPEPSEFIEPYNMRRPAAPRPLASDGAGADWPYDPVHAANPVPMISSGVAHGAAPRARRNVKQPRRFGSLPHADHNLLPLEQYRHRLGEAGPDVQPFRITVHPVALVAMDIHAHLCQHEVIGVLGGRYCRETRSIDILQARSVLELISTSDSSINVEMDPVDQQRVVLEMLAMGLQCVGWYHSHPTFAALPSGIYVLNQAQHQMHHGGAPGDPAPYVAAIVGPYDQNNHGMQSNVTWFYVERSDSEPPGGGAATNDELLLTCHPKALQVDAMVPASLTSLDIFQLVGPLVTRYAQYAGRTNFAQPWREKTTHLQKMVASMYTWCYGSLSQDDMYAVGKRIVDFAWRTFYPDADLNTPAT